MVPAKKELMCMFIVTLYIYICYAYMRAKKIYVTHILHLNTVHIYIYVCIYYMLSSQHVFIVWFRVWIYST